MPAGFGTLLEGKGKMVRGEKYLCECTSSLISAALFMVEIISVHLGPQALLTYAALICKG